MNNFFRPALRLLVLCLVLGSISSCKKSDETTVLGNWTTGNTFTGSARTGAVSFVMGTTAYVGTGVDGVGTRYNDLYSFDSATGIWRPVTPMPAAAGTRYNAVAFTAAAAGGATKAYIGTGYGGAAGSSSVSSLSDFWEFDPAGSTTTTVGGVTSTTAGSWRQVADLNTVAAAAGAPRYQAVAASVAGLGYVGCGYDGVNWKNDFYSYNAATNTWTSIGFPGFKRVGGFAFVINNQFYVGGGTNNSTIQNDFYSYNPAGGTWAPHRNLTNQTSGSDTYDYSGVNRVYGAAFVVNGKGYVTTGSNGAALSSCYVYDPSADTWTLKNPFKGAGRNSAVAFGIGNTGYVGLGGTSASARNDDFWKFAPDVAQE